ncbi:PPC domain-containing DNA-binding protein [uncultured Mucilaginibacter sp.]|uniref:PPC domain-containing DNA-binding protein n=1 Tax=uncultured Mucilaginibacter sp. TaxID=797541 RepID=UPI0025D0A90C|nr:PPC domain-containing DNA-binding protein [uncultured Mucilaginibacter sp.]
MLKKLILPIFLILLMSQAALAQDEYVKPGQIPVVPGKAPNLRVKLVSSNGNVKTYLLVFNKGDEILSGMTEFAEKYHVTCAHFTGIGAVSTATLGCLDYDKKMYHVVPIKEQSEILSFIGNIAVFNNKPVVHAHVGTAPASGVMKGGHLFEGFVWPTLEVYVTVEPASIGKKREPELGFLMLDPEPDK